MLVDNGVFWYGVTIGLGCGIGITSIFGIGTIIDKIGIVLTCIGIILLFYYPIWRNRNVEGEK